jgi:hypothetical protein
MSDSQAIPRLVIKDNDLFIKLLRDCQRFLIENPKAARTIARALVAEGRQFAQTSEGQRWKAVAAESELVKHGRIIWQAYGLDAMANEEPALTPSEWLDLIMDILNHVDLEAILSTLMLEEVWHGTLNNP